MSDLTVKMVDLINKGYTHNDIATELNISNKQLCNALRGLRLIGMNFDKKYYEDGSFIYLPKTELSQPSKKNCANLITSRSTDSIRIGLISDLHFGNEYECIDALYKICDFFISNGIHIVIIAGDFLDGLKIGRSEAKMHQHPLEQFEYAIKKFPYVDDMLFFTVLGNHDIDSLLNYGIDFFTYLKNFRHDIIPLGYGHGRINIKNDKIFVIHPLGIGGNNPPDLNGNYLCVKGHQHCTRSIINTNGSAILNVPSLSNIFVSKDEFLPGAMILNIQFKGGYFDTVYVENLLINNKVHIVSTVQYNINHNKERRFDIPIKYEEEMPKRRVLTKSK